MTAISTGPVLCSEQKHRWLHKWQGTLFCVTNKSIAVLQNSRVPDWSKGTIVSLRGENGGYRIGRRMQDDTSYTPWN